jgi:hypothetical protein
MSDRASTSERPADLWCQLESLFDVVWACERQWPIDDLLAGPADSSHAVLERVTSRAFGGFVLRHTNHEVGEFTTTCGQRR